MPPSDVPNANDGSTMLPDADIEGDAAMGLDGALGDAHVSDAATLEDAGLEAATLEDAALEDAALEDAALEDSATDAMPPPSACDNGELDEGETAVDCGGDDCEPCADGSSCRLSDDCSSRVCNGTLCMRGYRRVGRRVHALARNPVDGSVYATIEAGAVFLEYDVVAYLPDSAAPAWSLTLEPDWAEVSEGLAVSEDGTTLYVGYRSPASILPVDLQTHVAGASFELGSGELNGLAYPSQLAAQPGNADTVAAALAFVGPGPIPGVHLYRDGLPLHATDPLDDWQVSTSFPDLQARELVFTGPDQIYAVAPGTWWVDLAKIAVREHELEIVDVNRGFIDDASAQLVYAGGKLFSSTGAVMSPDGPSLLGNFGVAGPIAVAPNGSRAYFASWDPTLGSPLLTILCFDPETFVQTGAIHLDRNLVDLHDNGSIEHMELWGDAGLAFTTDGISEPSLVRLPDALALAPGCEPHPTSVPVPDISQPDVSNSEAEVYYIAAQDLERDPATGGLFASVSPSDSRLPNHVLSIAVDTPGIAWSTFAGSSPRQLSASDDGAAVWVGLDGSPRAVRIDVASATVIEDFTLERDFDGNVYYVADIEVLPGEPDSVAVTSYGQVGFSSAPLTIYTDGAERFDSVGNQFWREEFPWLDVHALEFAGPDRIYASTSGFSVLTLSETGIDEEAFLPVQTGEHMLLADGKVFSEAPEAIIDMASGSPLLHQGFPHDLNGPIAVPPEGGRMYVALTPWQIACVDPDLALTTGTMFFDVPFSPGAPPLAPRELVRYGEHGLALRTNNAIVLYPYALEDPPLGCEVEHTPPPPVEVPQAPDWSSSAPVAYGYFRYVTDIERNREDGTVYAAVWDARFPYQVVAFEPDTVSAAWAVRVANNASVLGLNSGSDTLYVGHGAESIAAVTPINLATLEVGERFRIGASRRALAIPIHFAAVPSNPDMIAVSAAYPDGAVGQGAAGLHVYENGVELYPSPSGDLTEWLVNRPAASSPQPAKAFFASATEGYAIDGSLLQLSVTPSGLSLDAEHAGLGLNPIEKMDLIAGKLFVSNGSVIDPSSATILGSFGHFSPMAVADDGSRVYFIRKVTPSHWDYVVHCMDPVTFGETGLVSFALEGSSVEAVPADIELWGEDGLAIRFGGEGIALLPDIFADLPGCQ